MLKNEAICLTCGDAVEAHTHEVADLEGNDLVMECWGICPSCGNQYSWYEHYTYQGVSHVRQNEIKARAF